MRNLKKSIITMMCLLAITTAWAAPVSESQARSIATQFLANHAVPSYNLRMALKKPMMCPRPCMNCSKAMPSKSKR